MKRKYFCIVLFLACLVLAGLFPHRAEAATARKRLLCIDADDSGASKPGYFTNSGSCSADLNGDGKADSIKLKLVVTNYAITGLKIYVGGKLAYDPQTGLDIGNWRFVLNYVKLSSSREYLELIGCDKEETGCFYHSLLQYDSSTGKIKEIRDFMEGWGLPADNSVISSVGSNYFYVTYTLESAVVGIIQFKVKYTLKDGKFTAPVTSSKISSTLGSDTSPKDGMEALFDLNLYQCAKKISFKKTTGSSTTAFSGKKYDIVKLTKVKLISKSGNIYGYFTKGDKGGWLKLNQYMIGYDSDDWGNSGYFRGVGNRLPWYLS